MEANQGVEVPIHVDGVWREPGERHGRFPRVCGARGQWVEAEETPLVKGRATLLRAWWELADGFAPRPIEGRLTVFGPDGNVHVQRQEVRIEGRPPCAPEHDEIFHFVVPAEVIAPSIEAQLELFEVEPYDGDPHDDAPRGHSTGRHALGVQPIDTGLRVVIVPIRHALNDGCAGPPEIEDAVGMRIADALLAINPVEHVQVQVLDPIIHDEPLTGGFVDLLVDLTTVHDTVAPGRHVYGFVDPCDGGPPGMAGLAAAVPETPASVEPWMRTALGRWIEDDLERSLEILVHEIGHGLGRRHVHCTGGEANADPTFPYEKATIGGWGWNLVEDVMVPSVWKEYMSYCGPPWVSDWGWARTVPFVTLPPEADEPNSSSSPTRLLVGFLDRMGASRRWFVTQGVADRSAHPGGRLEVATAEQTHRFAGTVGKVPDSDADYVRVELPRHLDPRTIRRVAWHEEGRMTVVSRLRVDDSILELEP